MITELNNVYGNETPEEILSIVNSFKIKGYKLHKTNECFIIWAKVKPKHHYIRLTLIRSDNVFYWNLEKDFIPFNYKHNHRENANIKSEKFKATETDKFFNYFLNMIDMIKIK